MEKTTVQYERGTTATKRYEFGRKTGEISRNKRHELKVADWGAGTKVPGVRN